MATEKSLRKKVATWGNAYKGIAEGSSAHKELISIFNDSGLCTRYKMTTSDAWCAMFVSDAFIATGLTSIFPCVECYCDSMISLAKTAGIWVEDDAYVPSVGDVILYDWNDSGSGDNTGSADHVGIVQSISGSSFEVIEGNKSDTVGIRSMTVNGRYIRGYITPNYASAASSGSSTSSGTTSGTTNTKTIDELADEVYAGKWGNDPDRTNALTAAGYDAAAVQARVMEKYYYKSSSSGSTTSTASSGVAYATKHESGYSSGKKYTVTASSGLNVRKGPGKGYGVMSALTKGTAVYYYGYYDKDSSGTKWLLVMANGAEGWVCSSYVA